MTVSTIGSDQREVESHTDRTAENLPGAISHLYK
jgi:hypothetical protein